MKKFTALLLALLLSLSLAAPAAKHQVLIQNVLDTGVDLIASMTLEREG